MPHRLRTFATTSIAVILTLASLRLAAGLVIPIVVSVLAALALDPFVKLIERIVRSRAVASAIVVFGVVLLLGASTYALSDDVSKTAQRLPEATERLRLKLRDWRQGTNGPLDALNKAAQNLEAAASEAAGTKPPPPKAEPAQSLGLREWIVTGSLSVVAFSGQLFMLVFFVYFLLASGDLFKRKIARIFGPALSVRRVTVEVMDEIHASVRRFVVVVFWTSVIVGVASYIAFKLMGLENPAVWAILAGALNTVPYVGGAVVTVLVFLVGFLQFGRIDMAALIAGTSLAITSLEGMLLTPWWMGRAGQLNNVAVFAGLLFWGWLWGAWGVLLAYPIMMVLRAISMRVHDLAPLAELLGE